MNLLSKIESIGNFARYSTDEEGIEYTVIDDEEKELLDSISVPRLKTQRSHSKGFSHPSYKSLPVEVAVVNELPFDLKNLLDKELSNPVIFFYYQGVNVDLQIIQSTGLLSYDEVYTVFDICSKVSDAVAKKIPDYAQIRLDLSYNEQNEIVLYRLHYVI